ncbi:MAG: hypothetical protein UZ03_NOB001001875 [Nitrospira sp. OLB3]|nr:MAG: hypothetical protein UZ03_NOB001001875 [Nitrospira sp. OLB3]
MLYKVPKQCSQCGKYFKQLFIVRDRSACLKCAERQLREWNDLIRKDSAIGSTTVDH